LGGYGISVPQESPMVREESPGWIEIEGGDNHSAMQVIRSPEAGSVLAAEVVEPRPGWLYSHSFGGKGAFPHWQSSVPVPANTPVIVYVNGTRDRKPRPPKLAVEQEGGTLVVILEGRPYRIRVPY